MRDSLVREQVRAAAAVFGLLTMLTGVVYPLLVTIIAQGVLPFHANGSVIVKNDQAIGSALIGQPFDDPRYFWGRPSATDPVAYNSSSSTGSNLGPTNPELHKVLKDRIEALRKAHPDQKGRVPIELVTTSASGLDPHISPAAAEYQIARVTKARGLPAETIHQLVVDNTEGRTLGVLGEPRVNVLRLNLALDKLR